MFAFDPQQYGPFVAEWIDHEHLCELGPGRPLPALQARLAGIGPESLFPGQVVRDVEMARCCVSAIWLWLDFLEESHRVSQQIDTTSGSYWHGIMHRREPDYSNAKYWFRRVGEHAIFGPLCREARELAASENVAGQADYLVQQQTWDPYRFVDLCEAVRRGRADGADLCRRIARIEWWLLFDYCYHEAVGASPEGSTES
jgi:hypothetical protein